MPFPVNAYALTWSVATKKGAVHLQVGGRAYQLPVVTLEELVTLGSFLKEASGLHFEVNGQTLIYNWTLPTAMREGTPPQAVPSEPSRASKLPLPPPTIPAAKSGVQLFISHSSEDTAVTNRLVELLKVALRIPAASVRCTSLDGYRLAGGATTDEQLRREVHDAAVFIGIVSAASLKSLYVLFELGARWGAGLPVVPLLAPGTPPGALSGPLASLNALRADNASNLHQLVSEAALNLNVSAEAPAVYQPYVERVITAQ